MAKGTADEIAIICYTSGTTGAPKGTLLSHRNLIVTATNAARAEGLRSDEEILSYLPMGWVGDHIFSYAQSIIVGFTANCPESAATVLADLKEIGPTYFFAPPRIWENILTSVMIRIEDAAWPKRAMVRFFLDLAQDLERPTEVEARLQPRMRHSLALAWPPCWRGAPAPLGECCLQAVARQSACGARRAYRGRAIGPRSSSSSAPSGSTSSSSTG
jgi:long-subunit acyl-CoA synthetase (AMP-forming)